MTYPDTQSNWTNPWPGHSYSGHSSNYGPPPMPSSYAYGERAWKNGSWRYATSAQTAKTGWAGPGPDARAAAEFATWNAYGKPYNPWGGKPPPRLPGEDYYATKLSDNGLGLSNMHIKAPVVEDSEETSNEVEDASDSTSQDRSQSDGPGDQYVWIPALSDNIVNLPPRDQREPRTAIPSLGAQANYIEERHSISVAPANGDRNRSKEQQESGPTLAHPEPRTPGRDEDTISRHMRSLSVYPDARRRSEDTRAVSSMSRVGERGRASSSRADYYTRQNETVPPIPAIAFRDNDQRDQHVTDSLRPDGSSSSYNRGPSPSRSATTPYEPSASISSSMYSNRESRDENRDLQRSQTLPNMSGSDIAHPKPYSAHITRAELGPTFSPSTVRTPIYHDIQNYRRHDSSNEPSFRHDGQAHDRRDRSEFKENIREVYASDPLSRHATMDANATPRVSSSGYLPDSRSSSGIPRSSSLPAYMFSSNNTATHDLQLISEEPGELLSPLIVEDPLPDPDRTLLYNTLTRTNTLPVIEDDLDADNRRSHSMPLSMPSRSPRHFEENNSQLIRHDSAPVDSLRPSPRTPNAYPTYPRSSPRSPFARDSSLSSSSQSSTSTIRQSPNPSPKDYAFESISPSAKNKGKSPARLSYREDHISSQGAPLIPVYNEDLPLMSPSRSTSSSPHTPARAQSRHDGDHQIPTHLSPSSSSPYSNKYTPSKLQQQARFDVSSAPNSKTNSSSPSDSLPRPSSTISSPTQINTQGHTSTASHSSENLQPQHSPSSSSRTPTRSQFRHVRSGYWNKRGDHLTQNGFVVYCPPNRTYPKELADYPEEGFMDHHGSKVIRPSGQPPKELPASIAHDGQPAEQPYDTFIKYILAE